MPTKKKPAGAPVPVQATPQEAVAHEEPREQEGVSPAKKKTAAEKKKTFSKKPAEAVKSAGPSAPGPQDPDAQSLSKRKPR